MEAISRLYNAHKTKKKFKRLWTEYVQVILHISLPLYQRAIAHYTRAVSCYLRLACGRSEV